MIRLSIFVASFALSGCSSYFVEQRTLDAYATLPHAGRGRVVVAATRADDGKQVFIHGGDARLEPVTDGTRRRVRVLRPFSVLGGVFVGVGAAWLASGLAAWLSSRNCVRDECSLAAFDLGIPMMTAGAADIAVGAIFIGLGVTKTEVDDPHAPRYRLLQP